MKSEFEKSMEDPEFRRLFTQEQLLMQATEAICAEMERKRISRTDLAKRLGKTKGQVTQMLSGGRNLTLRSFADVATALDMQPSLLLKPVSHGKQPLVTAYQAVDGARDVVRVAPMLKFIPQTTLDWTSHGSNQVN